MSQIKIKKIRCQYTPEGIKTFGKQKLGYIVGKGRDGGFIVQWDGNKSTSKYAEFFIDTSPLVKLLVEGETPEVVEEKEPTITPESIINIEKALNRIKEINNLKARYCCPDGDKLISYFEVANIITKALKEI
jgi:hypothetical protein